MELERARRAEAQPADAVGARRDGVDLSDADAAMAGDVRVDHALVVRRGGVQTRPLAAEDGLQILLGFAQLALGAEGVVEDAAVVVRDGGDVEGALHAPFDLEAGDAHGVEGAHRFAEGEVLHREGEAVLAGAGERVAVAAGVGAAAAVAAAAVADGGHEAEAAVAVAEGAVDEDLDGDAGGGDDADFIEGQFAREGDLAEAPALRGPGAFEVVEGHLGAGVQGQVRGDRPGEARHAEVLDDEGVRAAFGCRADGVRELRDLGLGHQRVERDEDLAPSRLDVREVNEFSQFVCGEIDGLGARGEGSESAVDGVRAMAEGRMSGFGASGGRQKFRSWFLHGPQW